MMRVAQNEAVAAVTNETSTWREKTTETCFKCNFWLANRRLAKKAAGAATIHWSWADHNKQNFRTKKILQARLCKLRQPWSRFAFRVVTGTGNKRKQSERNFIAESFHFHLQQSLFGLTIHGRPECFEKNQSGSLFTRQQTSIRFGVHFRHRFEFRDNFCFEFTFLASSFVFAMSLKVLCEVKPRVYGVLLLGSASRQP